MDTQRNLLFGVVAFQNGAVDADCLAETWADWVSAPTQPLADLFVARELMTVEQSTEVEKVLAQELASHGGDPQTTLTATMDGRSLEALGKIAGATTELSLEPTLGLQPGREEPVTLQLLSSGETETRQRYALTHIYANGGMGRVWLARDDALGRQIALKELHPDRLDNATVCSRFLYEAKITAQLEHPGIVPVYELGDGRMPYYTMRFVRGRTLNEASRAYHKQRVAGEADSLGMVKLLTAFMGVCHAVAYAHSRGIVHRDLKGQNVVLGDFGEVIVLDWGLAKRVGPDRLRDGETAAEIVAPPPEGPLSPATVSCHPAVDNGYTVGDGAEIDAGAVPGVGPVCGGSGGTNQSSDPNPGPGRRVERESGAGLEGTIQGQLLGTPAYMAPEQAQGRHDRADQRTDVYGLGAILYEILTGRPPFAASTTAELVRKVSDEAPTPPRQIVETIAPGLEAICLKALRKEPEGRYASASELAQEVQRHLADEPVQAYAEPWTRRAARWGRRHKTAVSAAAGLLVAATLTLGISTVFIARAKDEVQLQRNEARLQKNEAELQGQQARQAVHLLTKGADIALDERLDPLQKEFLENALAYYEKFTDRFANDPTVGLERGRTYQQMGNIQRKLGRPEESERAYRQALDVLQPLTAVAGVGRDARRSLARTRTLLADLLVRRGGDTGQAATLYRQAIEDQQVLANVREDPAASAEDRLRLGQSLKSQADLLRLDGRFTQAKPVYDRAITVMEDARTADPKDSEIRTELALAVDALGWIHRELGDVAKAEQDYGQALELLEPLVAEFPTVPRHREALARACNSLGLIEDAAGRRADAEAHFRRELVEVERLVQDFPDRPEHRRELARTLMNLGNVLSNQDRAGDAERFLRRSIELNTAIAAKHPHDVQVRLDLSKGHTNLGELLRERGDARQAVASYVESRAIGQALVKEFPDKPRYREQLAGNFEDLALAFEVVDPPQVEATYRASLAIYEKLVADHPDNVEYRIGQARCLRNFGPVLAAAGRFEEAEATYQKALAMLEIKNAGAQAPERLRLRASVLNNLGSMQLDSRHWQEGEATCRSAMAIFEGLVAGKSRTREDRHHLAIVQNNLGEILVNLERLPEAGAIYAKSVAQFEQLVAESPRSIDLQSHFGITLAGQATCLDRTGKTAEARAALAAATGHQRQAVQLSKNRPAFGQLLGEHMLELARMNLKVGAYDEAGRLALDLPKSVPSAGRARACYDAALVLARLVARVGADDKLPQAGRDRLARNYASRTVVLLREAIDTSPKLAEKIRADAEIQALKSRPEFQAIMNILVETGG
jgi:serine/threonine protein kinase